jgi:hypothetical protein
MKLLGNLDCEARWAGAQLPQAVQRRISLYATLFAACAPSGDDGGNGDGPDRTPHEIWVPARVDAARLVAHPGWTPPVVRAGEPPPGAFDLQWADPAARAANDRGRTLAIAQTLGIALPGARIIGSLAELDTHVAGFANRPWICKARWTAAGRDRARGTGNTVDGELRTRLGRMFERFGPLVFEPWLDRVADFGVCGEITTGATIALATPHRLITDPHGGFLGIELDPPPDRAITESLHATALAAATQLTAETGYQGPFAIDAFLYRDGGVHHLHPLCELNARYSFGWIAHGLARRLGIRRLGFDAPPPDATVLIAPGDDRVVAWCA